MQTTSLLAQKKTKKTLRSSQGFNLDHLNSGQMLLPMSYWSSGIEVEDRWHLSLDTVRFSGWISLRLGELCRITTKVLCAAPTNWVKARATLYVPPEPSFIGADRKHFSFRKKPYKVLMPGLGSHTERCFYLQS